MRFSGKTFLLLLLFVLAAIPLWGQKAGAQDWLRSTAEAESYWRDVGTVDAYWEANIDLTYVMPALDLYDRN